MRERIGNKMRWYAQQDNPLQMAKRLTNYPGGDFGFRIGDYRVTFGVVNDTIRVFHIDRRDKAYK